MELYNKTETTLMESVADLSSNDTPLRIANFEHFPAEILLPIFAKTNDVDLLNLALVSTRFEPMVREVFAERYADKYFVIKEDAEDHQDMYFALFLLFGDSIQAIEAIGIQNLHDNHWLFELLNKHMTNLEKLCFKKCSFKNIHHALSQHMNITHLTFRDGSCEKSCSIKLPEYCNLKSLELFGSTGITDIPLMKALCNSPQMERLVLSANDKYFTLQNIMRLIYTYLTHLKELKILHWYATYNGISLSPDEFVQFMSVLTSLESFAIPLIGTRASDLLERVYFGCTNIKRLDIYDCCNNYLRGILDLISTFNTFENFSLISCTVEEYRELANVPYHSGSPCTINIYTDSKYNRSYSYINNDDLLEIVRICKNLKKFVVKTDNFSAYNKNANDEANYLKNVTFHDELINSKPNSNIIIEFIENDELIGTITKEEIIWRKKLLHWVGYDPIYSRSNVRLLDLANVSEGTHKQPLNLIFNYLDLDSLYSFCMTSKKSKHLVHNYIQHRCKPPPKNCTRQRAIQRGKFYVTDEFSEQFKGIQLFGKCIKYLEVNLLNCNVYHFQNIIAEHCKVLKTLCLHTNQSIDVHQLTLPKVRHLIFYGCGENHTCSHDLSDVSRKCPNLETLEIGIVSEKCTGKTERPHLKKIQFKPPNDSQVKTVKKLRTVTKIYINNAFKYVRQYR